MTQKVQRGKFFLFLLAAVSLTACASAKNRVDYAEDLIKKAKFSTQTLKTKPFNIFSANNINSFDADDVLTVVIEGDGYSWVNRNTISENPTPRDPIGLKIATSLNKPVAYFARPCQYVTDPNCSQSFWSSHRFSEEIILSYMDALDSLSSLHNNKKFHLIGFSGGAYISFALSARRGDIASVTTIAGVLDPGAWTEFHNVSSLSFNNNIERMLGRSAHTSFQHMCGGSDKVAPCPLTYDFVNRAKRNGLMNHQVTQYKNAEHSSLWENALSNMK